MTGLDLVDVATRTVDWVPVVATEWRQGMPAHARGADPRRWPVSEPGQVCLFFAEQGKHVIYFAGYGELGYEDKSVVERVVEDVLKDWPRSQIFAHGGTLLRVDGEDGISLAHQIAKRLGVATTGIHPSVATRFHETHRVSTFCDHSFFVEDEGWGGSSDSGHSPTLRLHLDVSDEIVVIGGGWHAAHELKAFFNSGKRVRYFPAAMNVDAAQSWCLRFGIEMLDHRGAALEAWEDTLRAPSERSCGLVTVESARRQLIPPVPPSMRPGHADSRPKNRPW